MPAVVKRRGTGRPAIEVTAGKVATTCTTVGNISIRGQEQMGLGAGTRAPQEFARELREALDCSRRMRRDVE